LQNFSQQLVERSAAQQVMAPMATANGAIGLSGQPPGQLLVLTEKRYDFTYEGALVFGECTNQCVFASLVYLQGHCTSDSCCQPGGVRTGSGAGSGGKTILLRVRFCD
jgi:hypothetical protein